MDRGTIVKGLFWVYFENIAAQVVSFIITIVLARLLAPSLFGTIALVAVFINIANVFVNTGFSSALIQKKDADPLDYDTMFWFNLAISLFLYILLFFAAPAVAHYYNDESLTRILRVLAISIPLCAFNSIQVAYVSSHMIFKKTFLSHSGGALLSGIIGVIMAYLGFGVWSLVWQRLTNVAFNTIILRLTVPWAPTFRFSYERLKPMFSFGWRILVTGLMFSVYNEVRSLIIGKRYSTEELGYYDRGWSFPKLIANNIDATVTRVLFPALSSEQNNAERLMEKTRRAAKTSSYVMTPFLFILAAMAEPLVSVLLGDKWLPCVPYLQIMCFVWWLQPTQTCSVQAIKSIGRSDVYLRLEILNKVVGVGLLLYAVFVLDSVLAIAFTMLAYEVFSMITYGLVSHHYIGYKMKYQLVDILQPMAIALVVCALANLVSLLISNNIVIICVYLVLGLALYVLFSEIFKIDAYLYVKNAALSIISKKK